MIIDFEYYIYPYFMFIVFILMLYYFKEDED